LSGARFELCECSRELEQMFVTCSLRGEIGPGEILAQYLFDCEEHVQASDDDTRSGRIATANFANRKRPHRGPSSSTTSLCQGLNRAATAIFSGARDCLRATRLLNVSHAHWHRHRKRSVTNLSGKGHLNNRTLDITNRSRTDFAPVAGRLRMGPYPIGPAPI
jgi:hypothetical protein